MLTLLARMGEGYSKSVGEFGEKSMKFDYGGGFTGHDASLAVLFPLLHLVTWVLVIILLVALIRWIWAKGDKK